MPSELHVLLNAAVPAPRRGPDVASAWRRGETWRHRRLAVRVVTACSLIAVVAVAATVLVAGSGTQRNPSVSAGTGSWSTYRDEAHQLSVSYPDSWQLAPASLTPGLIEPVEAFALGTFPMRPNAGSCPVPEAALTDLGPSDAFVTVFLYNPHSTRRFFRPGRITSVPSFPGSEEPPSA